MATDMGKHAIPLTISNRLVREYEQAGVVVLRRVFAQSRVNAVFEECRANLDRLRARNAAGNDAVVVDFASHCLDRVRALCRDPLVGKIGGVLSRSLQMRHLVDHLFIKEPMTDSATPWHRDLPFYPVRGEQIPLLWIALTASSADCGGLVYAPGSHRWTTPKNAPREADKRLSPDDFKTARLTVFELSPGDIVVHHPLTAHGAGPNRTDRPRYGLAVRLAGDDASWAPRPKTLRIPEGETMSYKGRLSRSGLPVIWRARSDSSGVTDAA